MLPSLIINLFALLGKGLVWLAYRTEGMYACKTLEKDLNPVSSLFGIGLLIWIPCAMMTVIDFTYSIGAALYALGYLLVYIIWYFSARKTAKEMIASVKAYEEQKAAEAVAMKKSIREKSADPYVSAENAVKVPGWQCECGRTHADYVMTCACGITKKEMKLRKLKGENAE